MKKLFILLGLAGAITLASCGNEKANNSTTETNNAKFATMYDYSAISGINMLNSNDAIARQSKNLTDEQKNKVITNLEIVENLIGGGIVKSEEVTSDRPEYQTMYTITVKNMDGTDEVYTYYYNETIIKDHDDDDDDDFDDFFERDDEQESRLEGIVIMDDVEYQMLGEKEIENDEMEMKFKISLDNDTYVKIEQEKENNEEEYQYTKYQNGRKVYETEMEVEEKNHKTEFKFKEKTATGLIYYKYEIVNIDGKKYVNVHINENGDTIETRLAVDFDENGNPVYSFVS